MARTIIYIETSAELCSTALSVDGKLAAYRESLGAKVHASMTAVFIDEMLREAGLTVTDCDAVCVSRGPGSYTGLRVGVSTAKGLCFGAGIPLLSVGTLDVLVWQVLTGNNLINNYLNIQTPQVCTANDSDSVPQTGDADVGTTPLYIVPVIDARRMEVYTRIFRPDAVLFADPASAAFTGLDAGPVTEPEAKIIDADSFADLLAEGPVLFIGNAAEKCSSVITHPNAHFVDCMPKASSMLLPACIAFERGQFEDVAYFEPFYLKQFQTTVSKKSLW